MARRMLLELVVGTRTTAACPRCPCRNSINQKRDMMSKEYDNENIGLMG
jgi:hypothetical protein